MIQLNAASRLSAVKVEPVSHYERYALQSLGKFEMRFADSPKKFKHLGRNKDGLDFYHTRVPGTEYILCLTQANNLDELPQVWGILTLWPGSAKVDGRSVSYFTPDSFVRKEQRGKGIIFGMYQWALTQRSLMSGSSQTPDSHALWKRLDRMYDVQVLKADGQNWISDPAGSWDDPNTVLFIKGQK